MIDIPDIEHDPFGPGDFNPAIDLCPSRQAGSNLKATPLERRVALNLLGDCRSRANQRHISTQDIDHLWKFIDLEPANQVANGRYQRMTASNLGNIVVRESIDPHASELENNKRTAKQAASFLQIKDRAEICQINRNCRDKKERACQQKAHTRAQYVNRSSNNHGDSPQSGDASSGAPSNMAPAILRPEVFVWLCAQR